MLGLDRVLASGDPCCTARTSGGTRRRPAPRARAVSSSRRRRRRAMHHQRQQRRGVPAATVRALRCDQRKPAHVRKMMATVPRHVQRSRPAPWSRTRHGQPGEDRAPHGSRRRQAPDPSAAERARPAGHRSTSWLGPGTPAKGERPPNRRRPIVVRQIGATTPATSTIASDRTKAIAAHQRPSSALAAATPRRRRQGR